MDRIDDRLASLSARNSLARLLRKRGMIVFDNSDRAAYNLAFHILADKGFKRIDFYGSGPVGTYQWCTSFFARELDWLTRNTTIPPMQEADITRALNASGKNAP